jgi:protein O-mannosyl-transferase
MPCSIGPLMKLSSKVVASSLLVAVLLLGYGHTFNFPFQFDDYNVIVDEKRVHSLEAWWQSMPGMRPLLKLSYALNWAWDTSALYFRLVNLLVHFLTSFLVWRLCSLLLPYLKVARDEQAIGALLCALLFALHPAHTEVVTYVSSRSSGLMGLLGMASIFCFARGVEPDAQAPKRYLGVSLVFWYSAILVKETALVLPLAAILVYFVVRANYPGKHSLRSFALIRHWPWILLLLMPMIYLLSVRQYVVLLGKSLRGKAMSDQLLAQPLAHLHYFGETLMGVNLNIDPGPLKQFSNLSTSFLVAAALVGLIVFAILNFRKWPLPCFSLLWWFALIAPTNSLIARVDIVNDRQIYLASFGALLFVAVLLARFLKLFKNSKLAWLLPIGLICLCLGATWQRNWVYESEVRLWQASLETAPRNSRAWNNLGYAYFQRGRDAEAENAFREAIKIDPKNDQAFYNLRRLQSN